MTLRTRWETEDFDEMCWHDVHVHGFRFVEYEESSGTAELIFDIDYILEWLKDDEGLSFVVAQSNLQFHKVFGLKLSLDYAQCSAGMCAFSLSKIEREEIVYPNGFVRFKWNLEINWPTGNIEFESTGFTQWTVGAPITQNGQSLEPSQRNIS